MELTHTAPPEVERPQAVRGGGWLIPAAIYVGLLIAFWYAAAFFRVSERIGGHMVSAFSSFALLLAPYWAFGFGAAESLRRALSNRAARVLAPGLLVSAYLIFTLPRVEFRWVYAAVLFAIPVALSALFEFGAGAKDIRFGWRDAVALCLLGLPVEFRWLTPAWPHPGLSAMPKLLLVDAGIYAYLVVRALPGIGFDFRLRARDVIVGVREWALFAPIVISLGLVLHFIRFHAWIPHVSLVAGGWLVTFFFVAIPEEFFFRGLLQNLLENRFGSSRKALLIASPIFGLSHFNKGLGVHLLGVSFDWKYVLLASLAGIFYGRAWRDRRRLFCSGITHASVDVVWGVWFRA